MANPFLNMLKGVLDKVQERNAKNPNVKTADTSIFDKLKNLTETKTETKETPDFSDFLNKVNEVKVENEADPHVETADKSVFEDMMKEIEALKAKVAEKEVAATPAPPPVVKSAPMATPSTNSSEMMAMSNSMGGSLALREKPDMGAAVNHIRLPDNTLLRVLEYSDKSIILDGKETKFVLVEFDGQRGWILDSYLNFN